MLDLINRKIEVFSKRGVVSGIKTEKKEKKKWANIICDSLIIGAITYFSVWSGTLSPSDMVIPLKATGLSFLLQVSYERGIKKYTER